MGVGMQKCSEHSLTPQGLITVGCFYQYCLLVVTVIYSFGEIGHLSWQDSRILSCLLVCMIRLVKEVVPLNSSSINDL